MAKGQPSKANQRQSKHNSGRYTYQYDITRRNKIRKLKRTIKHQPNNAEVKDALKSWESDIWKGLKRPSSTEIEAKSKPRKEKRSD